MSGQTTNLILFDIDFTLLDSAKLRATHSVTIRKVLALSKQELEAKNQMYHKAITHSRNFNPITYIRFLTGQSPQKGDPLYTLFFSNRMVYKKALYPETVQVLTNLAKRYTLGIFSEGYRMFQKTKLQNTGTYDLFNPRYIYIFRRKLAPQALGRLPVGAIVVDDKPEVVKTLYTQTQTRPILINRTSVPVSISAPCIRSLTDLTPKFVSFG